MSEMDDVFSGASPEDVEIEGDEEDNDYGGPVQESVCAFDITLTLPGGAIYGLGRNQLFPVFQPLNGGMWDVSIRKYSANFIRDPDGIIQYICVDGETGTGDQIDQYIEAGSGLTMFNFKDGVGYFPESNVVHKLLQAHIFKAILMESEQTNDLDAWLPQFWVTPGYGSKFWTPGIGMVRAIKADMFPLMMDLTEYKDRCIKGGKDLTDSQIKYTIYNLVADYINRLGGMLYIGRNVMFDDADTDKELIPYGDPRLDGLRKYIELDDEGLIIRRAKQQLSAAILNGGFAQEDQLCLR